MVDIVTADKPALKAVRREIRMIFQDPVGSLNPRMTVAQIPDLTETEYATIVNYLVAKFPETIPYDGNSRLPRALLQGKAVNYRAVTSDLVNTHAEPHDVAMDPNGKILKICVVI